MPAGVGFATLRAVIKLWFGASPWSSGVDSAGNGPAMRSAVIGAACDDLDHVATFVTQSATLTHSDPRAEHAARAVAFAAYAAKHGWSIEHYRDQLRQRLIDDSAAQLLETIDAACDKRDVTTQAFARDVLKSPDKVGGFCNHSVPLALHAWMRHPTDLRAALEEVIRCGGDTDTNGAIAGGIIGAGVGREGMPTDLLGGIHEWPRTVAWMSELAEQTDSALRLGAGESAPRLPFLGVAARNALFLVVVLGHGLRRLFPPY
ncbi:MAG: ADP-ribosylglycohydrolase family protein [Phycisphaeraceae bacterium]|nr:ADP-ribosylglycohydrolase family protein [Phycisphaeraceae bacterium]